MKCQIPREQYDPEEVKKALVRIINARPQKDSAHIHALQVNRTLLHDLKATRSVSMKGITEDSLKRRFAEERTKYAQLQVAIDRQHKEAIRARKDWRQRQEDQETLRNSLESGIRDEDSGSSPVDTFKRFAGSVKDAVSEKWSEFREWTEEDYANEYDRQVDKFWKSYKDAIQRFRNPKSYATYAQSMIKELQDKLKLAKTKPEVTPEMTTNDYSDIEEEIEMYKERSRSARFITRDHVTAENIIIKEKKLSDGSHRLRIIRRIRSV